MSFKIAIIGAGPAGCMLARLLTHRSKDIDVSIFESEPSFNFRSQGGTLDLHVKTGQHALRKAGLYDEFLKYARFDSEAMSLADKKLLRYVTMNGSAEASTTGRPEIDRPQLRRILHDSLPRSTIQWKHKLTRVDDNLTLHFEDQLQESGFDLVVGADGGWSKVRPFLTTTKPYYSGIAGHAFSIPDAQKTAPELYDLVNRGSLFAWSDGKSIMSQYMGDGSLSVGTWALRPESWRKKYDVHDAKVVKKECIQEYADWDPRLVAFTQRAEDHTVPRDLYMLPIGHNWQHVKGATLIGDAAHLMVCNLHLLHPTIITSFLNRDEELYRMPIPQSDAFTLFDEYARDQKTPFAGEGVNLALEDCLKLADAILTSASTEELDLNVRAFEDDMFKRARKTAQLTYDMMHAMFMIPGSPRNGIERYLIRAAEDELGWWLTKLFTPLVYAYFFVFKLIW